MIKEYMINSLSEFIEVIDQLTIEKKKINLFRGQNIDSALIPKIARNYFRGGRQFDEKRMLDEFRVESVQYLSFQPKNDLENLTIAQHHGLPTRLLDWTENALTALYFAVYKKAYEKSNAVVWVLNIDRSNHMILKSIETNIFELGEVKLFKPASIIPRVSSQFGWFSYHPMISQGFYQRIDKDYKDDPILTKIVIGDNKSEEINTSLEKCGINIHSIFRDLDSLGQYIFNKYRKE